MWLCWGNKKYQHVSYQLDSTQVDIFQGNISIAVQNITPISTSVNITGLPLRVRRTSLLSTTVGYSNNATVSLSGVALSFKFPPVVVNV